MEKHLLITVGEDRDALYGVRFFAGFFREKAQTRATILTIAPQSDSPGRNEGHGRERVDPEAGRRKGKEALEASRRLLIDRGFPEGNITTKMAPRVFGTVKDIALEGVRGLYDAVVLGRRGYVVFEKMLATSVSREIMDRSDIGFPLWICRRPEEGRKNVLLCVADGEPSMHIADHAGFILEREEQHTVTLFHVDDGTGADKEAILEKARQKLIDNGVSGERIKRKIVSTSKVVAAILEESRRGEYAAVAVGRGGSSAKGVFHKWVIGSRSMKLLESIEKAALWVSK